MKDKGEWEVEGKKGSRPGGGGITLLQGAPTKGVAVAEMHYCVPSEVARSHEV